MPAHCEYMLADAGAAVWLVDHLRGIGPERLLPFLPFKVEQLWKSLEFS